MTIATRASKAGLISGITVPDSSLADTESVLLFNHSSRVYYSGALADRRRGLESIPIFPHRFVLALGLLCAALLLPGLLQAHNSVTGALTGVVQDSSGAIVPGAEVRIVDTVTNATITVTTNDEGRYSAPLLKPSRYQVTATATGLSGSPAIVTVLVGQVPNLDLTLSLTSTATTVNVSSQSVQLTNTQSPALVLGLPNNYIDGRNVTQYQFVDDLSMVKGNHTLRFGYNFRRVDISDYDSQQTFAGTYALYKSDFANGPLSPTDGSEFTQALANQKTAYLALYNLGVYAQDEWQLTPRLKLTAGIRFDRTGNPLCNNRCFSLYNGTFPKAGVITSTPYDMLVDAYQSHPFSSVEKINPQGRSGFNYDVTGDGHTVVRGGFGMFTDLYPAGFLRGFIDNLPNVYNATIVSGNIGSAQVPGTAMANALASFNGVEAGINNGASSSSLTKTIPSYAPPTSTIGPPEFKNPTYREFSLQAQRQFSKSDAISLSYVGNTGYDEIITNGGVNAHSPTGFGGLPIAQPDPNFAGVNSFTNAAHSNYHGASVTYKHSDAKGLTIDATYTYSKAMDDASNSGITNEPYNYNSYYARSNYQIDPYNVGRLNYSVSDYDIRNSFVLDFVYDMPFHFQNAIRNQLLGGRTLSGKSFYRSGQSFTVYNRGGLPPDLTGWYDDPPNRVGPIDENESPGFPTQLMQNSLGDFRSRSFVHNEIMTKGRSG